MPNQIPQATRPTSGDWRLMAIAVIEGGWLDHEGVVVRGRCVSGPIVASGTRACGATLTNCVDRRAVGRTDVDESVTAVGLTLEPHGDADAHLPAVREVNLWRDTRLLLLRPINTSRSASA
jgi:hypothetical protein